MPKFRKTTTEERLKLAAKLRQAREEAGLLQKDAAETLGIPASVLCVIELGQRKLDIAELAALAKLYGKDPGWFFEGVVGNSERATTER